MLFFNFIFIFTMQGEVHVDEIISQEARILANTLEKMASETGKS